jgi:hypothetical protein
MLLSLIEACVILALHYYYLYLLGYYSVVL